MNFNIHAQGIIALFGFLVVTAIVFFAESGWAAIISILFFVIGVAALKSFNPLHPSVWLIPFMYLYHFSIFILEQGGVRQEISSPKTFLVAWFSLGLCAVITSAFPVINKWNFKREYKFSLVIVLTIWISLILSAVLISVIFLTEGYQGKSEAVGTFVVRLFPLIACLNTISAILIYKTHSAINFLLCGSFTVGVLLFVSIITGERNFLFSFLIAFLMLAFVKGHLRSSQILLSGIILLPTIPILGAAKLVFQQGGMEWQAPVEIFIGIFNGEFRSAGLNLDVLVRNEEHYDKQYGATFVGNIVRSIVPSFFINIQGPGAWFNETFFPERSAAGYGMGFTLLGEGYLNFGFWGSFVMAIALGAAACFAYINSSKNNVLTILYVGLMPLFIYGIRADIANILSPFLKTVLLPTLTVLILSLAFRSLRRPVVKISEKNVE